MGFKARSSRTVGLFTGDTLQFLADLEQNNDRDWFVANQQRYEAHVREPARELIRRMSPHITSRVSAHFAPSDKKLGGSLMRIYRDVRFSRDKSPYKTNIGIHIRQVGGKDMHGPGLYVHIDLNECFIGVGSWRPDADSLSQIRRRIAEAPGEWKAARDDQRFRRYFRLGGESLERIPRGYDDGHPFAEDSEAQGPPGARGADDRRRPRRRARRLLRRTVRGCQAVHRLPHPSGQPVVARDPSRGRWYPRPRTQRRCRCQQRCRSSPFISASGPPP